MSVFVQNAKKRRPTMLFMKGGSIMNISDFIVYLWLFPVVLQILLPLAVLCGWTVIKLPVLLIGNKRPAHKAAPIFAN